MIRLVTAGIGLVALSGCSLLPGGSQLDGAMQTVIDTGVEDRRAYNDRKAEVLPAVLCDISVGAYARLGEGDVKRGVALICGLDAGDAVAADLRAAAAILDAMRGMNP